MPKSTTIQNSTLLGPSPTFERATMFPPCHVSASLLLAVSSLLFSAEVVLGQASSCSNSLTPTNGIKPSVASGYQMALVATGLTKPRSIAFDTAGNLMVVESGAGISKLALQDDGGNCLSVRERTAVVQNREVTESPACVRPASQISPAKPRPRPISRWKYPLRLNTRGSLFLVL